MPPNPNTNHSTPSVPPPLSKSKMPDYLWGGEKGGRGGGSASAIPAPFRLSPPSLSRSGVSLSF